METDRDKSEFNMAISYLNRLNWLFYESDIAAMQLNAYGWFHCLSCIYRELSTSMKPDESIMVEQVIWDVAPRINRLANNTMAPYIPMDIYKKLHQLEMLLRHVLKESGLLLKEQENPAFSLK